MSIQSVKMATFFALLLMLIAVCDGAGGTKEEVADEYKRSFKLTVIVLTMNRPLSLARLLKSIEATEMEDEQDFFDVEIHVDKSIGLHYDDCVKMATNFSLPFSGGGTVRSRVSATNRGLRAAWFDAWYPGKADDEFCIIVEDDLELSQLWYVWLKKAWAAYGHREDVAGIALSRQFLKFKKPDRSDAEIMNGHLPFLYKLVGTWAFAPHPKRWREFLDWFKSVDNEKFDPYVPGMVTSDWLHMHTTMGKRHMTWEQWHIYHSEHHNLYTMYINLPNRMALVSNWREAGVHTRGSFNSKDYPTLDYCAIQLQEFPEKLRKYDWDCEEEKEIVEKQDEENTSQYTYDVGGG